MKTEGGLSRIKLALAAVGPGLFLIGYNIGTGSVTTMAKSGAEYGMSLFWALVLSCVFTFVLMVAYGQLTLVSGRTALFSFKSEFRGGTLLALYILAAIIIGELLALMGIMGIVADLLQEGMRLLGLPVAGRFWIILVILIPLYFMLWFGRYQLFEKVLTFFVILMGLCFLVVFFMVKPSWPALISGLVPRVPNTPGAFGLVAAMAGTTCSAAVFIVRSTVVAEKGWTIEHLKVEKRDAFVSATMMLFLSGIIMAVAAGTLHVRGDKLQDTVEMIGLFEPLGGKIAAFLLILGIAGAGLSTVFPIVLIAPWLICDYRGQKRDIHSPLFRILMLVGILFGFGMVFMEQRPPALMIFSQAFQACILPAVAIPALILINRPDFMKQRRAGCWMNTALVAVIIFSLVTSYFALKELVPALRATIT
jgi:Mn2+/Fe2+ NRAMP family transporter